jgi:hypothetical protein
MCANFPTVYFSLYAMSLCNVTNLSNMLPVYSGTKSTKLSVAETFTVSDQQQAGSSSNNSVSSSTGNHVHHMVLILGKRARVGVVQYTPSLYRIGMVQFFLLTSSSSDGPSPSHVQMYAVPK